MAWHTEISPEGQSQESQLLSFPACSFWPEPNSHCSATQIPEFTLVHFGHTLAFKMAFFLRRGHGVPIYPSSATCKFFSLLKNPHRVFREESHEHRKAETGSHVTPAFQLSHPPLSCLLYRLSVLTACALLLREFPLKGRRRESICSSHCSREQQAQTAHLSAVTFSLGSWIRAAFSLHSPEG